MNKKRMTIYRIMIVCMMFCLFAMEGCGKATASEKQEAEQINKQEQETAETFFNENEIRTEPASVTEYASIVEVTINPELRLYLDADSEALMVEYCNADARDAYAQLDLIGKSIDVCMEEVVTAAIERHYLESGEDVTVKLVDVKDENVDEAEICNVCYEAALQAAAEKEIVPVIKVEDSIGTIYQAEEKAVTTTQTPEMTEAATRETPIPENDITISDEGNEEKNDIVATEIPSAHPTEIITSKNSCSNCGGTGRCQECKGNGYRGAGYAVSCPRCHGSFTETCGYCDAAGNSKMHEGICDFGPCMGTHVYSCTICGGGSKPVTCESCSGNGKCRVCSGSGYV